MGQSNESPGHSSFNEASQGKLSLDQLREKLKGYYLVRSYAPDANPYDVISDLPEEEGQRIAVKNDPVRGEDNYRQRIKTESWLRDNAAASNVKMDKDTPAYFGFTNDPDFIVEVTKERNSDKRIIVLPADQVDLSNWSFTMDDHFFANLDDADTEQIAPSHAQPHPLHGNVLNVSQLVQALEKYGCPDDPYKNNFEAQMWAAEPTLISVSHDQSVDMKSTPS